MKFTTFTFLIFFSVSLFSQPWLQKPAMPGSNGLDAPFSFSINNKLYVGGGWTGAIALDSFFMYDPASSSWTTKTNIPQGIYSSASFALNGKGYVVCGATQPLVNTVYQYDPVANTWQTMNPFPGTSRQNVVGFNFNGKGYMCGGFIGNVISEVWQYNDTTDSWAQMASIPGPGRNGPAWLVVNGQAFIGMGGNSSGTAFYSDFYRFDPVANTYTPVDSAPIPRSSPVNFTIGSTGYVGLGGGYNGEYHDFYKYDPIANTWTLTDSFPGGGRFGAYNETINGVPYIGCGVGTTGSYYIDNWSYGYPAGTQNISATNSIIKCYPSPTSGGFTIDMSGYSTEDKQISIYDEIGQPVYQTQSTQSKLVISSKLSSGLYTVSVIQGTSRENTRVVVE